jgi:hypothetical protein
VIKLQIGRVDVFVRNIVFPVAGRLRLGAQLIEANKFVTPGSVESGKTCSNS